MFGKSPEWAGDTVVPGDRGRLKKRDAPRPVRNHINCGNILIFNNYTKVAKCACIFGSIWYDSESKLELAQCPTAMSNGYFTNDVGMHQLRRYIPMDCAQGIHRMDISGWMVKISAPEIRPVLMLRPAVWKYSEVLFRAQNNNTLLGKMLND